MQFDIIDLAEEDIRKLSVVQMKMLRTAQQKKDELYRKAAKELKMYRTAVYTSGMYNSTLISSKESELMEEAEYQTAILVDNLIYNLSVNDPTGDGSGGDGDESAGYIVDYSLSYNERYVIVRDYYMSIEDPNERLALYSADEVAKKYLSSYYSTLYNVLYTYSK